MRRTFALVVVAIASLAAAAVAALLRPAPPDPAKAKHVSVSSGGGPLRMAVQLDRRHLSQDEAAAAYLQIDLAASASDSQLRRVPVNAVLILDRSGSMSGAKMERARDAARALVQALGQDDRLAVVSFASEAMVALPSTPLTGNARARALDAIERIRPAGGTNLSAAFDLAAPELARGRAAGRVDKVFLASDGRANEGVVGRAGLLRLCAADLGSATLSTFGVGDDYDEDLMTALAAQAGGRARYIDSPQILPGAFRDELRRAATLVARRVRIRAIATSAADSVQPIGFTAEEGWVRLPDFAASEERRVLYSLRIRPRAGEAALATVELRYETASGEEVLAQGSASAVFTREAALLREPAGEAAANGARAEMAARAELAAQAQESGRADEARAQVQELKLVAQRAAAAAPAQAAEMSSAAESYRRDIASIDSAGGAASKRLKEKTFDAVRAPVAGW